MSESPEDIQRQIAELEALLKLPMPDIARQSLEAQLAALQQQQQQQQNVRGTVTASDNAHIDQAIGVNLGTVIYGAQLDDQRRERLVWYLQKLATDFNMLSIRGLITAKDRPLDNLSLNNIYTMLATTQRVEVARGEKRDKSPLNQYFARTSLNAPLNQYFARTSLNQDYDPDYALPLDALFVRDETTRDTFTSGGKHTPSIILERALLATEAIQPPHNPHHRLVLLGDPGSGKSTFMKHLAWLFAERGLNQEPTDYPPAPRGWKDKDLLLPIFLPLQKLARILATAKPGVSNETIATALREQIQAYDLGDADDTTRSEMLQQALHRGRVLLLFDGLDEVPIDGEANERVSRQEVVAAVHTFALQCDPNPVVMTCRQRAWQDTLLPEPARWAIQTLAPFTMGQVRFFFTAWFTELVTRQIISPEQSQKFRQDLMIAISKSVKLQKMAETPLLLTLMALVRYNNTELPRDRSLLYEAILDLLLGQWDSLQDREGVNLGTEIGLPNWNSDSLKPLLDQLSYQAHRDADSSDGRGRLARGMLRDRLTEFFQQQMEMREQDAAGAAVCCLRYLDQRSGLLAPDDDQSYVFVHLTMQEHCAGRYMLKSGDEDPVALVMQYRGDDRWREPIFLGMGVADMRDVNDILLALVEREPGDTRPRERWYRDLILAVDIGKDREWVKLRAQPRVKVNRIQDAIKQALAHLLDDPDPPLPAPERVHAGLLLGELGDPRPSVNSLPPVMVEIPGGTFVIGNSEEDAKDDDEINNQPVTVAAFALAHFPITNAQYALFIAEGGYDPKQPWWDEAGRAWLFRDDAATEGLKRYQQRQHKDQPEYWHDERFGKTRSNHPVVGMSWYEAVAFCRWFTQHQKYNPEGYTYRLPTEAEWEYAARRDTRRKYPWGDAEPDREWANYDDKYDGTSAYGCFPQGATPDTPAGFGLLDMAGNVGEWTGSVYQPYPYDPTDGREDTSNPADKRFVNRGGGWYLQPINLPLSHRLVTPPDVHFPDLGLRPARHLPCPVRSES